MITARFPGILRLAGFLLFFCIVGTGASHALEFEHVMNIGTRGMSPGQFKYVEDFALTIDGHLAVTDASHAYVQIFNKTSGAFITRFAGIGDDDEHLTKPEGISVDADGRFFVADYTTGEVKIYDRNYQWLDTFSEYGKKPGQTRKTEFSDIYDGRYYVPEAGNDRVSVFDLQGKFLFMFGGKGSEPGKMLGPEASKFNSEGTVYVADLKNDRVQAFDKMGKFLFTWGTKGTRQGEMKAPSGIGIDKNDNVYVGDIGNDRIQVFDKNGKFITGWGKSGAANGEFDKIHGVLVDSSTGWVYIADTGNNRIQVFKPVQ
jgi:DNA-binding beta-propeller fold protein YncE